MSGRSPDDLSLALRHLHRRAGEPSTRDIGKAINYSHTTVAQTLNGSRRPSWPVLEKIVGHLGGNIEQFRQLWLSARELEDPLPPLMPPPRSDTSRGDEWHPAMGTDEQRPVRGWPDDRVEVRWDVDSQSPRFFVPSAVAWEWIMGMGQEGTPRDERL